MTEQPKFRQVDRDDDDQDGQAEDETLERYPETDVELRKDIYTPDREFRRRKSKYHKSTIFKELNLANFDRLDQEIVLKMQSIEETLLFWGLDDLASLFNASKQSYVSTTRSLDGFERKRQGTQRSEIAQYGPDRQGILERAMPKKNESQDDL